MHAWTGYQRALWSDAYDVVIIEPVDKPSALLYECFSGISGDMHLGALVDLGVPAEYLQNHLDRLQIEDEFTIHFDRRRKQGIEGVRATISFIRDHPHPHRRLPDIISIIRQSEFNENVESIATRTFHLLAEAEAKVHGIDIDKVHFHEVGATDTIVDVVGAAIGIDYLSPSRVYCGPIELGSGIVECAHGTMPVPAPATAELLKQTPTNRGGVDGEATTPTGAAILSSIVNTYSPPRCFYITKIGYGIGFKDFQRPNVLRLSLGTSNESEDIRTIDNVEIECNIDDMSPEAFEPLIENLFAHGAKDVFLTPIVMKKSRPAIKVSVIADVEDQQTLISTLLSSSTSLGTRTHPMTKFKLPQEEQTLKTSFGSVGVKITRMPNGRRRWKTEHNDIAQLARENDIEYIELKKRVDREVQAYLDQ